MRLSRRLPWGTALLASTVVALPATLHVGADTASASAEVMTSSRRPWAIQWLVRARTGAARRLRTESCQAVLDDFTDAAGRSLRTALASEGVPAAEFVGRLHFFEAPEPLCVGSRLAVTTVGSRVIYLCSARFRAVAEKNGAYVEAAIIHEALHALGLGENPPTSELITERVLARCGR